MNFPTHSRTRPAITYMECRCIYPCQKFDRQGGNDRPPVRLQRRRHAQNRAGSMSAVIPLSLLNHGCPQDPHRFHLLFCLISCRLRQRLAQPLHLPGQSYSLSLLLCTHVKGRQLVTDRFALANGSGPACNTEDRKYCGGTYQGVVNHLDYIQNMGFDAIWISPVVSNFEGASAYGEAYHGLGFPPSSWRSCLTTWSFPI